MKGCLKSVFVIFLFLLVVGVLAGEDSSDSPAFSSEGSTSPARSSIEVVGNKYGPHGALGGCAQGEEKGFVTVTEPRSLPYWGEKYPVVDVEPGDELRFCRYAEDNSEYAVVTVWSRGIAYVIPRSAIGPVRSEPTVREVTKKDVACIGREVSDIKSNHGGRDRKFLNLARERDMSLAMLQEISYVPPGNFFGGGMSMTYSDIPPCSEFE